MKFTTNPKLIHRDSMGSAQTIQESILKKRKKKSNRTKPKPIIQTKSI